MICETNVSGVVSAFSKAPPKLRNVSIITTFGFRIFQQIFFSGILPAIYLYYM